MTKEELSKKIIDRYPDAEFEVISWDGCISHPITIKCLSCGREKTYTRVLGLFGKRKTRFCTNCSETLSQKKVKEILEKEGYEFIKWSNIIDDRDKTIFRVDFRCPRCGQISNKRVWDMLHRNSECAHCGRNSKNKNSASFQAQVDALYPGQYEIIDDYKEANAKIKVRHKECGFIYKVTPNNLLQGKRCPRCARYNSIGEMKIKRWLDENHIQYEVEKNFSWIDRKRYDFYVPDYNLLIEFNGVQHYVPISYFLRSRTFEEQQESDRIKEEQAKIHGYNFLVIRYDEVDKIPQILSDSTTISEESRFK